MKLTARKIKKMAVELGADLVGIANIERFAGAPLQQDPKQIMPECRSVIVLGFRFMRGSLRGIEEGTLFSNYSAMGYGGITHLYMPMVMMSMAKYIEDHGWEAIPIGQIDHWRAIDNQGRLFDRRSRSVAPGKAYPDVSIHQRIAAYLAGLGEIGYSKVFLTPRFGPRQRFGVVLTEAELQPDPLYDGPPLCNRCMACVKNCSGQAISSTRTVKVELAGRTVEWGELDCTACCIGLTGGRRLEADEEPTAGEPYGKVWYDPSIKMAPGEHSPFYRKPDNIFQTGEAVCGGQGCVRACMISLEARGVLKNKFHLKFRRRPLWKVDWSVADRAEEGAAPLPDGPTIS